MRYNPTQAILALAVLGLSSVAFGALCTPSLSGSGLGSVAQVEPMVGEGQIDLQVNTITGDAWLLATGPTSLSAFEIYSPSGSLNPWGFIPPPGGTTPAPINPILPIIIVGAPGNNNNTITWDSLGNGPALPPDLNIGDIFNPSATEDLYWFSFDNNANENDDNNTVIYVPEPASLSLLALGAVGLIARRRGGGAR